LISALTLNAQENAATMGTPTLIEMLRRGIDAHAAWRSGWDNFHADETLAVPDGAAFAALDALSERLRENYPFFHPDYAGQMLKPPHPIAIAAYTTAMLINPNNHALDGGPATARMELDVVKDIAGMFGFTTHLGHLTSGGTMANIEALWVSRTLHPGKAVAYSSAAHYTHQRMCGVLEIPSQEIRTDADGRMDMGALEEALASGSIGTIVATMGTTSLGAVDPLEKIIPLARMYGARVHADAAYGGFFMLCALQNPPTINPGPFLFLKECDSVVVDPHKHGLQPYGCGCIIFRAPSVGALYKHDSPYTYFTSKELHLGEISLECSRAGATAAALWCTLQCLPLRSDAGLGPILATTRAAAIEWNALACQSRDVLPFTPPELDIVTYLPRVEPFSASAVSTATETIFRTLMERKERPIYLATLTVDAAAVKQKYPAFETDQPTALIFRSVLMKPEHRAHVRKLFVEIEKMIAR
jgi:glutamate/tyrosine decarboxylase-like PLP-dependent enzyme